MSDMKDRERLGKPVGLRAFKNLKTVAHPVKTWDYNQRR